MQDPAHKQRSMIDLSPSMPEDNYEISDHASGDEDNDSRDNNKHVPRWVGNYLQELLLQGDVDADTVFGSEVPPCDLNQVFTAQFYGQLGKERPKRRRGSSGNWKKDGLQDSDVKAYKKRMGHVRKMPLKVHKVLTASAYLDRENMSDCVVECVDISGEIFATARLSAQSSAQDLIRQVEESLGMAVDKGLVMPNGVLLSEFGQERCLGEIFSLPICA
jgi:hypothetical protein